MNFSAHDIYNFFFQHEQKETALQMARSFYAISPDEPQAWDLLSRALFENRCDFPLAAELSTRLVKLYPEDMGAKFNAARCLNFAGRADEALILMSEFLQANPDSYEAKLEVSLYYAMLGEYDKSHEILEYLLTQKSDDQRAHFNMGWTLLRRGEFQKGMQSLAVGRDLYIWGSRSLNIRGRRWLGEDLKGKKLLIVSEGGFGDEILSARFVPFLAERGADIILSCSPTLENMFSRLPGLKALIGSKMVDSVHFDYWVPGMDIAGLCGVDYSTLPNSPYLFAEPKKIKEWKKKIPQPWFGRKRKIGLRWQGNPAFEHEQMRSPDPDSILGLSENLNFDFYSLQRDVGAEAVLNYPRVKDLSLELKTWEDTAGAIANLDLIITTCTSVAHLAAAMGKEVWVIVPLLPYYVWAVPGDRSQWYPNVRIFRQRTYGDWMSPIEEIKGALKCL